MRVDGAIVYSMAFVDGDDGLMWMCSVKNPDFCSSRMLKRLSLIKK